jgi:hypothetical protein
MAMPLGWPPPPTIVADNGDDVSIQRAVLRFNHGNLHGNACQLRVTELAE